jgi:hypothetical protein
VQREELPEQRDPELILQPLAVAIHGDGEKTGMKIGLTGETPVEGQRPRLYIVTRIPYHVRCEPLADPYSDIVSPHYLT